MKHQRLFQRLGSGWLLILVAAIAGGLWLLSGNDDAPPQPPGGSNWKYRWGDSPLDDRGVPVWTYEESSAAEWIPGELFVDNDPDMQQYAWVRVVLPAQNYPDPTVIIFDFPLAFEVYVEGKKLYASAEVLPTRYNRFTYYRTHIFPLPRTAYPEHTLFLRVYAPQPEKVFQRKYVTEEVQVSVESGQQFLTAHLKQEIPQVMFGALFLLIGGGAGIVAFRRRRHHVAMTLAFAALTITAGLWLMSADIVGLHLLFDIPPVWLYLEDLLLYIFPVGVLAFSEQIVSARYRVIIRRMWQIHLVYAGARLVLDLTGLIYLWGNALSFYILTSLTLLISAYLVARSAFQGDEEARILTIGYLIFGISTLPDLLEAFGVMTVSPQWLPNLMFPYGLLVLILGLLYLVERRFTKAEKAQYDTLRAKQEAEMALAANQAKSDFLSKMSHELRTPLNAILGYTQILKRDTALQQNQRKAVDTIHRSGERLLSMIEDVLDFSKIEAHKMELAPAAFHLTGLIKHLEEVIQIRAQQKGLRFECETSPDLPAVVYGDEKRIWQILLNLLANAVKFTEKGKVILKIENGGKGEGNRQYSQPVSAQASSIQFSIVDTGIGIAPERLKEIFLPFYQVAQRNGLSAGRYSKEGTGLGLAISQELVRMMGSELYVKSEAGQGTTFWFDLKLACLKDEAVLKKETTVSHIIGLKGEPRKILIVDDNAENRDVLRDMLAPLGFTCMEAVDGRDALKKVHTWQPEIVLMDLVMPTMDGYTATREIRKLEAGNWKLETRNSSKLEIHSPRFQVSACDFGQGFKFRPVIIAISASTSEQPRQKSFAAGCDDFLTKPVKADELLDRLRLHAKLEWIYAESVTRQPASMQATEALSDVLPPEEILTLLREYAELGNVTGIQALMEELQAKNPEYQPFIAQIQELTNRFEFDQIRKLLRNWIIP